MIMVTDMDTVMDIVMDTVMALLTMKKEMWTVLVKKPVDSKEDKKERRRDVISMLEQLLFMLLETLFRVLEF